MRRPDHSEGPKLDRASTAETRERPPLFPHPIITQPPPRQQPPSTAVLRASIQPSVSVVMDSDQSSHSSQDVEIPPSKHVNTGDGEPPAVNGTTIVHADTNVKKTMEELVPDTVEIEPSVQEGEEGAEEGSVPSSPGSDDGHHDVSLNGDNPNVGLRRFPLLSEHYEAQEDTQASAVNEHPAPQNHDTSLQQSETVVPSSLDVRIPSFPRFYWAKRFLGS